MLFTYPVIKLLMKWYTLNRLVSVNNKSDFIDGSAFIECAFSCDAAVANRSGALQQLDTVRVVKLANVVDVVVIDVVSNRTR